MMKNKQLEKFEEEKRLLESSFEYENKHSNDFQNVQEPFDSKVIKDLCDAVNYHTDMIEEYRQGFKLIENAVEACQKSIKALGTVLREYDKISKDHELRLLELESKLK